MSAIEKQCDDAFRGAEAKDGCGQTVQEGRECHSSHLEDAHACGAEISQAGCAREDKAGLSGY